MKKKTIKGFKVTSSEMTCRDFKFELNKVFRQSGKLAMCENGFHFCEQVAHCFNYYNFNPKNRVFEIEATGEVLFGEDKHCTNSIKFIRELTWDEVLKLANNGIGNTGFGNTGNSNTGNWNTGDWNTGSRNTGYSNTGDRNTGDWNTGYSNTGDWNTGDSNTGYSNTGDRNTGAFCTGDAPFPMFNKPSSWTEDDFKNSKAFYLLTQINTKIWVSPDMMTDEEKSANPSWKTAGGYLKDIPFKEAFGNAWNNWTEENKKAFTDLPNFDKDIFFEITGVKI